MRVRQLKLNLTSEHWQPENELPGFRSIACRVNVTVCARMLRGVTVLARSATVSGLLNGGILSRAKHSKCYS